MNLICSILVDFEAPNIDAYMGLDIKPAQRLSEFGRTSSGEWEEMNAYTVIFRNRQISEEAARIKWEKFQMQQKRVSAKMAISKKI